MRQMFDSITPSAIPASARMVACYVDGAYANESAARARFPTAICVPIAVFASTNAGTVLDVETGDATPAQAPGWVVRRRTAGVDPTVYCNTSTWPAVRAAFQAAGVPEPHYWIAQYDGSPVIPAGAVAKQYADPPTSGGNYDVSAVADYWPGIDQGGPVTEFNLSDMTPDGIDHLARMMAVHQNAPDTHSINWGPATTLPVERNGLHDALAAISGKLDQVLTGVGGVDADVKTSASSVLAAIAAGAQVNLTAAQVSEIEAQLAKSLPGYTVNIVPAPAG